MVVEIKVPSVGESITEAVLAEWFKKDGDSVKKVKHSLYWKRTRSPWRWRPKPTAS